MSSETTTQIGPTVKEDEVRAMRLADILANTKNNLDQMDAEGVEVEDAIALYHDSGVYLKVAREKLEGFKGLIEVRPPASEVVAAAPAAAVQNEVDVPEQGGTAMDDLV